MASHPPFEADDTRVYRQVYCRLTLSPAVAALTTPARVLVTAPFYQPFRWSRLLWTYVLPAFPLVMAWDVAVSCLRVYGVEELRALTADLGGYHWDIGVLRGRPPLVRITYLIGLPLPVAASRAG